MVCAELQGAQKRYWKGQHSRSVPPTSPSTQLISVESEAESEQPCLLSLCHPQCTKRLHNTAVLTAGNCHHSVMLTLRVPGMPTGEVRGIHRQLVELTGLVSDTEEPSESMVKD